MSSFGKVFHVEKRWKLIRELGSGAYGFVMYVEAPTRYFWLHTGLNFSMLPSAPRRMRYPGSQ